MQHDARMTRRLHQPPPDAVVVALVRAGVSLPTALAMEPYKAAEILDLLRLDSVQFALERPRPA